MSSGNYRADVLIVGGSFGGVAAALAATDHGLSVIMTEETDWLGGQLTSQLVPLDEHLFIETTGANRRYRKLRDELRHYYRRNYPLNPRARADPYLNPGAAFVSPVSVEPRVAVAVIDELLAGAHSSGRLRTWIGWHPIAADVDGDHVSGVILSDREGNQRNVEARWIVDATELGELLPLAAVEHVSGRESRDQTGEPNAADSADPTDMQSATWCFVVDHLQGEDHTIDRPSDYSRFRNQRSPRHPDELPFLSFHGALDEMRRPQLTHDFRPNRDDDPASVDLDHRRIPSPADMWSFRRVAARRQFEPGFLPSDIVVINWDLNDYTDGPLFGTPDAHDHWRGAKELARSLVYWIQTEAPRPDGGSGWPGLRLRPDVSGTEDGFAMYPYIRESRRILARHTILEQEISSEFRKEHAVSYADSVGVGHYFWIDRHATTGGRHAPNKVPLPFEIPLRSLIPRRIRNLLPACKNIGTTQITNGCYRLHPVEWSIGEAVGELLAYCTRTGSEPHAVADSRMHTESFQEQLTASGVQLRWPEGTRWVP